MDAIKRAIEICGGNTALARQINVDPSVVAMWKQRKQAPKGGAALAIEEATNGEVSIHELDPVAYPVGRVKSMFKRKRASKGRSRSQQGPEKDI